MWELACLRWHPLGLPDRPRCLHRRQASSHIELGSHSCFCGAFEAHPKLWKTNPAPLQSATYSRRKSLFCHSFDLSPSAVEPAVGNVGVAGWKPSKPWLTARRLFFDQALFCDLPRALSTCLKTQVYDRNMSRQPVDKSVTKLWKDLRRGRNDWPGAIVLNSYTAKGLHTLRPRSSKKLCRSACSPCL
ncbi:hypothetical protein SAMN04490182_6092 [Pseudomonas cedrina]|uniref:Uncharacterized protein n=1 Tax=Pseudomonas cedrina TaxID=651740 RepID=A0ABY0V3Z1_PSECE|nr:hypothetical protein SAMN04490182_6092 [Pseudomonas cedrina]